MKGYAKAVEYRKAMQEKCYWCISREYNFFDCQFNQGIYFDSSCNQEDYKSCPEFKRGERIKTERRW